VRLWFYYEKATGDEEFFYTYAGVRWLCLSFLAIWLGSSSANTDRTPMLRNTPLLEQDQMGSGINI
jgi:hypothetical protein